MIGPLAGAAVAAGSAMKDAGRPLRVLARRAALARQPQPQGVRSPPLRYLLGEVAAWMRREPSGEHGVHSDRPQPVMIIPGFGAHPKRMQAMADALEAAGHSVHHWGLGFNLGPTPQNFAFLMRRVAILAQEEKAPVALIGWSLGGLYAREIAHRMPDQVAKVITLGSPFSGDPRANNAWRVYQAVTGHAVDAPPVESTCGHKPPVPTIALWSPRDGVIHPRSASGWRHERDRAVAMRCTHLGFACDREVIAEVLVQLERED
ncbi:esterase/lipase family protein [Novosphingobium aquimarinum]|uniref:esterase/lipase family protein n=1 Tax=Novosphingobium aquimarinum TaxID=2682494 RepID=UPI002FC2820F